MLRKVIAYTWFVVYVVAPYVGYIFLARHDENEKIARQNAAREAEQARDEVDRLGGHNLKIVQFYAPPVIAKGQTGKALLRRSERKDRNSRSAGRPRLARTHTLHRYHS